MNLLETNNIADLAQNVCSVSWPLILSIAFVLLCLRTEIHHSRHLRPMRRALSVTAFLVALDLFVEWLYGLKFSMPEISWSATLTTAYALNIIIGIMLLSLLNERFVQRRRIQIIWTLFGVCMAALWGTALWAKDVWIYVFWAVAAINIAHVVYFFVRQLKAYNHLKVRMNEYYSSEAHIFSHWIFVSSALTCLLVVLTSAGHAYPRILLVTTVCLAIYFIYLFVGFLNYALRYKQIDLSNDEITVEDMDTSLLDPLLNEKAEQWALGLNFLAPDLTADNVAAQMGVKRDELFYYTHAEHEMSFREWIYHLRLEEAKKLLSAHAKMPLDEVADQTGFESKAQLAAIFLKENGIALDRWVQTHQQLHGGADD